MAGVYKYLMKIKQIPESRDSSTITKAASAIKAACETAKCYKVLGENFLAAIVDGPDIEKVLCSLNNSTLDLDITSSPQRRYEKFAKTVLGVDDALCTEYDDQTFPQKKGPLIWETYAIKYQGTSTEVFISEWKKGAVSALEMRKDGKLDLVLYKTVGERTVDVFAQGDGDIIDDITCKLPMNNITVSAKAVQLI